MGRFGVELILVLFGLIMTLGFIATYITAVVKKHVNPGLPYISNTGSYPPESCVFSFVLSSAAIVGFVIVWIRYRHIKGHYADSPAKVQLLNAASFFFGFLSVVGIILVGSFQDVNVIVVHVIGAFMVFICGAVYSCLQTCLSYRLRKVHPQHVGRCVFAFRVIVSLILSVSCVCTVVMTSTLAVLDCPTREYHRLYQGPIEKCYILHIVGACFEWVLAFSIVLYFLTFHPDFKRIHADLHIQLRHHHSDVQESILNEHTPLTL